MSGFLTTYWSRSRSRSNWSWSRPRFHEVLVSVSYVLVSWCQIDHLFLKCSDFWLCSVNTHLYEYFTSEEIVIIVVDYSSFIVSNM